MSFARSDAPFPLQNSKLSSAQNTRPMPTALLQRISLVDRGKSAILRDTRVALTLSSGNRFRNTAKVKALLLLSGRGRYIRLIFAYAVYDRCTMNPAEGRFWHFALL